MNNRGGKRSGAGRKPAPFRTKTKQVRGVPTELFDAMKKVPDLQKKTIEFWQSLVVIEK